MQRRAIGAALLVCAALSGAFAAPEALAQPSAQVLEQAKAEAKAAANRGQALYDQGNYEEAIGAFREAEQKFHAPTFLLMIARAHEKRGRLIAARTYYRQVVDERLANYAPKVFFESQEQAKEGLESMLRRIPRLTVKVDGAPADDVKLIVDGEPANAVIARGSSLELDPGEHTVTASALGRVPVTRTVTLPEGARVEVTLELKSPPPKALPPPVRAPQRAEQQRQPVPAAQAAEDTSNRGFFVPAAGAFGVAGVALGVGIVTGAMSFGAAGALAEECDGSQCFDNAGGDSYDRARTLSTVSNVGFVIGGVAAAAGVTLLLWPRGSKATSGAALLVAPDRVSLQGRF